MARQFPWIKVFWGGLDEDSKKEIAQYARIICKSAPIDSARATCLERLRELCSKYKVLDADCYYIAHTDRFLSEETPYSDIEFLVSYFGQFADCYPDGWENKVKVEQSGARKFLVHNDYYGDIVCTLVDENDSAYYFNYTKDGVEIMARWRVLKRTNRVKEELKI